MLGDYLSLHAELGPHREPDEIKVPGNQTQKSTSTLFWRILISTSPDPSRAAPCFVQAQL